MTKRKPPAHAMLPAPGERWRHWKGFELEIVALAHEELSGNVLVVYRSLDSGTAWVRPLDDFLGRVKLHDGKPAVMRFVRVKP